ncbi:MAG: hypothetical protein JSS02_24590 [Planctomycetes bacterium]|nr:hypothetical protein [Planctomycetota bacterium]
MLLKRRLTIGVLAGALAGAGYVLVDHGWHVSVWTKIRGRYTIAERLGTYGPAVEARLTPALSAKQLTFPPKHLALVAFKDQRTLLVFARSHESESWRMIRQYPILGLSGANGPKLREGDRQVPEGRYEIESLNPSSRYHLALRLNYPNTFDRARALDDGRTHLGADIMIHGGHVSIGCLAIGDPAVEELFVLSARTRLENITVLIAPTDFRTTPAPSAQNQPPWINDLYDQIRADLSQFPED